MDKQSFFQLVDAALKGDNNAAVQVTQLGETNIVQYYSLLCQIISDTSLPYNVRLQCNIFIANTVQGRSSQQQRILTSRWLAQDPQMRSSIRELLLTTLDSPEPAYRNTTVKAIAYIGVAEIPQNSWPELIPKLTAAALSPEVNMLIRISSVSIIGLICSEISSDCTFLGALTDSILTAIATAIDHTDYDFKIAGLTALNNTIKFCSANFAKDDECRFLMSLMCKAATPQQPDPAVFKKQFQVQALAWDCLASVVGHYYDILNAYIIDIFNCSIAVIEQSLKPIENLQLKEATQLASIQAIEFWHCVATHEEKLQDEIDAAAGAEEETDLKNLDYTQNALPRIAPLLLQCMCLQGDDPEDESYNITYSALNCLTLFASRCDSTIFHIVIPQVEQSINSQDWRFRDAALTALGCVLSSPAIGDETINIIPTLKSAFTVVVNHCKDSNEFVQVSAAWCVKQYCCYAPGLVNEMIKDVVEHVFLPALRNPVPRPSGLICTAIYELSQCIWDDQIEAEEADETAAASQKLANPLAPHFEDLTGALLQLSANTSVAKLLMNSYEALTSLIQCGAGDENPNLTQLLQILGERLQTTTQQYNQSQQQPNNIGSYKVETQGLICGAVAHLIYRLPREYVLSQAGILVNVFTTVLTVDSSIASEALTGIEAIISVLEKDFAPHMELAYGQILTLINRYPDVGSVVARAFVVIGAGLAKVKFCNVQHSDAIISTMFAILATDSADQTGKLSAIDCLGDLIEAIQDGFTRYYDKAMDELFKAAEWSLSDTHKDYLDEDLLNYLLKLQISICKVFNTIAVILARENAPKTSLNAVGSRIDRVITYATKVVQDPEATLTTKEVALNLLGDLFDVIPDSAPQFAPHLSQSQIPVVLRKVASNNRGALRKAALSALASLARLK